MNGRMIGGALAIVGGIVLLVAIALPWYAITASGSESLGALGGSYSISTTENDLPGSSYTVTASCSGSSTYCSAVSAISETKTYSSSNATNTGNLYGAIEGLLIGGGILAILGAILAFVGTGTRSKLMTPALILVVLGLVLGFAAAGYLAADSVSAYKADSHGLPSNGTGPFASFSGSCSEGTSGCFGGFGGGGNGTATWGPTTGWYLAWVGGVILLISVVLIWRGRSAMGSAAPSPAPMATDASTPPEAPMDASSSPPMGGGGASP